MINGPSGVLNKLENLEFGEYKITVTLERHDGGFSVLTEGSEDSDLVQIILGFALNQLESEDNVAQSVDDLSDEDIMRIVASNDK